jgi:hypothetical protein
MYSILSPDKSILQTRLPVLLVVEDILVEDTFDVTVLH